MPSLERLISLLVSRELSSSRVLSSDAIRRIYGTVAIEAAMLQVDADDALDLLDRYGFDRELLARALEPAPLVAILSSVASNA
jgi:hypothetical protein